MKFIISTKKLELSDAIRQRLEKKIGKLDRYFRNDATASVFLLRERNKYTVEVTVTTSGMLLRAQETTNDLYAAIDKVVDILERQIRKNKTRLEKRLREGAFEGIENKEWEDVEEEEYELIKTKSFELKPMDVEEAILQMNLLGHNFYLFQNAETLDTCVVYKRKNGGYGLIEPQR